MYATLFYSQRHDIVKKRVDAHDNVIEARKDGIGAPKVSENNFVASSSASIFLHVLYQIDTYFHKHIFFFFFFLLLLKWFVSKGMLLGCFELCTNPLNLVPMGIVPPRATITLRQYFDVSIQFVSCVVLLNPNWRKLVTHVLLSSNLDFPFSSQLPIWISQKKKKKVWDQWIAIVGNA